MFFIKSLFKIIKLTFTYLFHYLILRNNPIDFETTGNLPFKADETLSTEEIYDIFGKFGAIRQIRLGNRPETRGTAFVVYEDIYDAKTAVDHLSGFNVQGRYLIVLYYQPHRDKQRIAT